MTGRQNVSRELLDRLPETLLITTGDRVLRAWQKGFNDAIRQVRAVIAAKT